MAQATLDGRERAGGVNDRWLASPGAVAHMEPSAVKRPACRKAVGRAVLWP